VALKKLHDWRLSPADAIALQKRLADAVIAGGEVVSPRLVAGTDMSVAVDRRAARAAVVVLEYPSLKPVEVALAEGELEFPYVPGLLSFREAPLLLRAWQQLKSRPDLVMVDGQGLAHPGGWASPAIWGCG
jgi:deoxyribonuclease V